MNPVGHWRTHYCTPCKRNFDSANNLKMSQHLNSRIHQGRKITCPFCKRIFATASGSFHHLEGGSCKTAPSFNRENIHRFFRQKDSNGIITDNLLEWRQGETWSTSNAFNGSNYECYVCHRQFASSMSPDGHFI
ncbi:MAG: hypothetical protein Q9221_003225 [Calogaya cf. arnoldii]